MLKGFVLSLPGVGPLDVCLNEGAGIVCPLSLSTVTGGGDGGNTTAALDALEEVRFSLTCIDGGRMVSTFKSTAS